jgi:dolichyl-phosphate-mannose-protein mannosyltransferase
VAAAPAPSLAPPSSTPTLKKKKSKSKLNAIISYKSEGVEDNDVFLLPVSDYWVMLATTVVAAFVRVFRIWQPTSVVFDEVQ